MAMTKSTIILSALMTFLLFASGPAWAQAKETRPAAKAITGPDAVDNQLDNDQDEKPNLLDANLLKSWEDWKADIADRSGLSFGLDYNALGLAATDSLGDETSASGVFRLFGTWNMIGRGTKNTGGIVFKVEHRHAYTDVAPSEFGSWDTLVSSTPFSAIRDGVRRISIGARVSAMDAGSPMPGFWT